MHVASYTTAQNTISLILSGHIHPIHTQLIKNSCKNFQAKPTTTSECVCLESARDRMKKKSSTMGIWTNRAYRGNIDSKWGSKSEQYQYNTSMKETGRDTHQNTTNSLASTILHEINAKHNKRQKRARQRQRENAHDKKFNNGYSARSKCSTGELIHKIQ